MGRFETEFLTQEDNLKGLARRAIASYYLS